MNNEITERKFYNGSVTALYILENENLLVVGTGGYVEIRDIKTGLLKDSKHLWNDSSDSIHGFRSLNNSVLAFGGKSIKKFEIIDQLIHSENQRCIDFNDWLMDVSFSTDSTIFALTAHNNVIKRVIKSGEELLVPCQGVFFKNLCTCVLETILIKFLPVALYILQ